MITSFEDKSLIKSFFSAYGSIPPEILEFLYGSFQSKSFSGHEFIGKAGSIENYIYLVKSGVAMIYVTNRQGERVIMGFSFAGNISGIYDSFLTQKPSQLFLETITPMRTIRMARDHYFELFDRFPEMMKWRAQFFEGILLGRLSRETEILTQTAQERFEIFMKRCPEELLQIPQKYLASYLNMKPETFSRMRAKRN